MLHWVTGEERKGFPSSNNGYKELKTAQQLPWTYLDLVLQLRTTKPLNITENSIYYSCHYAPRCCVHEKRMSKVPTQEVYPQTQQTSNSHITLGIRTAWLAVSRLYTFSSTVHSVMWNFPLAFWDIFFTVRYVPRLGLSCFDLLLLKKAASTS